MRPLYFNFHFNDFFNHQNTISPMLSYTKKILTKVSFDARLFEKELKKAIKLLVPGELNELREWCLQKFGKLYRTLIDRSFRMAAIN